MSSTTFQSIGITRDQGDAESRFLFSGLAALLDQALLGHKRIGFNPSDFEKSIVMDVDEYLGIVTHDGIFACSTE